MLNVVDIGAAIGASAGGSHSDPRVDNILKLIPETASESNKLVDAETVEDATDDMATKTWVEEQGFLTEHQDISGKQNKEDDSLQTTQKYVVPAINEVNSIAKGANQALSYGNYSTMITAFNSLASGVYNVGQNVMIITVEVPDLWISSIESSSTPYTYVDDTTFVNELNENGYVQVGFYKLSMLETQKVDLTAYRTASAQDIIDAAKINGVKVAGTELTPDSEGKVTIPISSAGNAGLFLTSGSGGLIVGSSGNVSVYAASDAMIEVKESTYRPIVPANLDKAVMEGLGNNSLTWSDEYKKSARDTIGTGVRITDTTDPQGDVEMVDMETMDIVEAIAATSTHNEIATAKAVYDTMTAAIAAAKPQIIYH